MPNQSGSGILAISSDEAMRLCRSTIWTEQYGDRVRALLQQPPTPPVQPPIYPVRGILLQNIYGGQSGLMSLLARDTTPGGNFMVSIVGLNQFPTTSNTFRLTLQGGKVQDDGTLGAWKTIGNETPDINCIQTAQQMQQILIAAVPGLSVDNVSVGLGNPYVDPNLNAYAPLDSMMTGPDRTTGYLSSWIGSWFININNTFGYDALQLLVSKQTISSLCYVIAYPFYDNLSPETTVVTDTGYRHVNYPWQLGCIVTCLDYADLGYGILSSTARTFDIDPSTGDPEADNT